MHRASACILIYSPAPKFDANIQPYPLTLRDAVFIDSLTDLALQRRCSGNVVVGGVKAHL